MWRNTPGCFATSVFLCAYRRHRTRPVVSRSAFQCHEVLVLSAVIMNEQKIETNSQITQQLAHMAGALQQQRTGLAPKAVTVILSEDTLVVTLRGALTPAEKDLASLSLVLT